MIVASMDHLRIFSSCGLLVCVCVCVYVCVCRFNMCYAATSAQQIRTARIDYLQNYSILGKISFFLDRG